MDRAPIEARVKELLAEQLAVDPGKVTPDARFAEDLNADSLDLVEVVSREQHGAPLVTEPQDQRPHVARAGRIETRCGLVEQDDVGMVEQGAGERHALFQPFRELRRRLQHTVVEIEQIERRIHGARRGVEALQFEIGRAHV